MWNCSDEESTEDEGDNTRAYLGAQFFYFGAVEFWGAAAIRPAYASTQAYGDACYLMGRTQTKKVSQVYEVVKL